MNSISKSAFGVGISAIFDSQIFPFMLSSAFTARTAVKDTNQVDEVKKDIWISFALSEAFNIYLAYLLKDKTTFVFGTITALAMVLIYEWRGEMI